jgi:hypothetical protein
MRYAFLMRTTVNLEPEALARAKMLSRQRGVSLGEIISQLILKSTQSSSGARKRNGVLVFPRRAGARVDIDIVNELRE